VAAARPAASSLGARVNDRYELVELISDRVGVQRFRARDHAEGGRSVVVVRQALPAIPSAEPVAEAEPVTEGEEPLAPVIDEVGFDEFVPSTVFPATQVMTGLPVWPSVAWERRLLHTLESPALPAEIEYFTDGGYEYLVEEVPSGQLLWDGWDDPDMDAGVKFGYLTELAELLHSLHTCNAIVEGLRPDIVVIDEGRVRLSDLSDLLPLPFAPDTPVRGTLYTAPELLTGQGIVDARADLYSFGAMLYALHVGRELNERTDFNGKGDPKPFIPQFPDIHPAFGRLMTKTFRKNVESRFPTDEASKEEPTGFVELIRTLEVLRRTYDNVRLEVASWTSTGIVRTGNEDAFAVLHAVESRQDDLGEAVLIILCDGMGGYEAGEVAAAMTINAIRKQLTQIRPFSVTAGESPFLTDVQGHGSKEHGHAPPPLDVEAVKQAMKQALRDANRMVFQTSRAPGSKRRGMGCTAEVVYIDGRHVIVGHVGDSRTYHLHEGTLVQITRDQTLVNRLVELGSLTEEEAETHPRRNELQQAIGGQPDVEPGLYQGKMKPGDWVVVCSDGLTNHVNSRDLSEMLRREAWSAETAARRLVNLTLIEGATDNVTVVAVRAT
jgi:protein phosphatase